MKNIKMCLNTHGCFNNQTKYIKEINSSNFCSIKCYKLYIGKIKPEVSKRKIFNDQERQKLHDLFRWALGAEKPDWVKQKERRPEPEEWIVKISDGIIYLWDDFQRRYVKLILERGIFNDLSKLIADGNSEYYRRVISRINEVQCNPDLINSNVPAIQKKRGVKQGTIRGPYKERIKLATITCKGCSRTLQVTSKRRKQFCSESCRRRYWRKHKKGRM